MIVILVDKSDVPSSETLRFVEECGEHMLQSSTSSPPSVPTDFVFEKQAKQKSTPPLPPTKNSTTTTTEGLFYYLLLFYFVYFFFFSIIAHSRVADASAATPRQVDDGAVCSICAKPTGSQRIKTSDNKYFHKSCLVCVKCNKELLGTFTISDSGNGIIWI